MTDKLPTLEELRADIDRIDQNLHDLIKERTHVIDAVRRVKIGEKVKIRPSREAEMLYHLSAEHDGKFPKQVLFSIWRQMISGTLALEGPFCVAIHTPDDNIGYVDLGRDHYGNYTKISTHMTSQEVIATVASGDAAIGILPYPVPGGRDDWWHNLPQKDTDDGSIRIVTRLPFFGRSSALGANLDALAISYAEPQETGRDISLFIFSTDHNTDTSVIKEAFIDNGLSVNLIVASPPKIGEHCQVLVEVDGFHDGVGMSFPGFTTPLTWIGSYSVPIDDAELLDNTSGGKS